MQYVNYEEDIVQRYGVVIEGWTFPKFVNPSEMSTALEPLRKLHDALKSGTCQFVKLTSEERKKRTAEYRVKVASGEITAKKRKPRKDIGVKRKRQNTDEDVEDRDEDEEEEENEDEDEGTEKTGEEVRTADEGNGQGNLDDAEDHRPIIEEAEDVPQPKKKNQPKKTQHAKKASKDIIQPPKKRARGCENQPPTTSAPSKRGSSKRIPRDDAITHAARRKIKSRAIIDDEDDGDAAQVENTSGSGSNVPESSGEPLACST